MTTAHIVFFTFIILNILFLVWWGKGCEWDYGHSKFPTKGHALLLIIASCVPILNILIFIGLLVAYLVGRIEGDLVLKENKFNKFWFGVGDDDDE